VEITCRVYRPRRARDTPLFRLVEQNLEECLRVYEERFAKAHGPLRPVVERVLRAFLTCGLVERGFARAWCGTCRLSYLIPYSCRGRSFCPSCEKKRSLLWAEWLREEVLEPVPHRHVVLTMPRLLRGIFRKRRELLLDLWQCGAEALSEYMRREAGADTRPGIVVSVATSGDLLQWHVHLHVLATDGAFSDDATFHPLATWDAEALMRLFRERLLARLVENGRSHPGPGETSHALLQLPCQSRARRSRRGGVGARVEAEPAKKRRCTASWARLIAKVFHADPLPCRKCGGELKIVAYLHDQVAIKQVLAHLGLSPPEEPKPPPAEHEVVRVPVDEEGREMEAP
jgi:hypothetical protein